MWHGYVLADAGETAALRNAVTETYSQPAYNYHNVASDAGVVSEGMFDETLLDATDAIRIGDVWSYGGRAARGCAGATHYSITTLADAGAGSLREALEASGRRVVTFAVSGNIELASRITLDNPHATILGQVAPDGGICIKDSYIQVVANDVSIFYLRCRPGEAGGQLDALHITAPAQNVLIDHCSLSWAVDENLGIAGAVDNIEIRYCIISECLYDSIHEKGPHSRGVLINSGAANIQIHHCLMAHNNMRNPQVSAGNVDVINNLALVVGERGMLIRDEGGASQINWINNHYVFPDDYVGDHNRNLVWDNDGGGILIYRSGNISDGATEGEDGLRMDASQPEYNLEDYLSTVLFPMSYDGQIDTLANMYTDVLANAGATLPKRDAVDIRIVADVEAGTGGLIDEPADVGGWPDLTV